MAYSEFTVSKIKQEFGIHLDEKGNHFAKLEPIKISQRLREQLDEGVPLASMINTEKARSEQIISPVLLEARRQAGCSVSIFSGVEFNVDEKKGLKGNCDFLLSLSEEQLVVESPIVAVAESKNDNVVSGYGQCLAEMVAVREFNKQRGEKNRTVYGIATTGSIWKFVKLLDNTAYLDSVDYHISQADRIVGIIVAMLRETAG